jgi:hypothetical protein
LAQDQLHVYQLILVLLVQQVILVALQLFVVQEQKMALEHQQAEEVLNILWEYYQQVDQ